MCSKEVSAIFADALDTGSVAGMTKGCGDVGWDAAVPLPRIESGAGFEPGARWPWVVLINDDL
ncbi:hypothetical protein GCM10027567_01160 [Spongiibacter taiwanensis]